jgi:hypothetical protein
MSRNTAAGSVRWWMPLLILAGATAALILVGWMAGVDVKGAGRRLHDSLREYFHSSTRELTNDGGTLRLEFDSEDHVLRASHDGKPLPLEDVLIEDDYLTVTSLRFDDGELMYWRLPLSGEDELRESVRNPRWRLLVRVHPRDEGEPAGLRVGRVDASGAGGRAGLRVGDVIVGVDGSRPPTSSGLAELLSQGLAERAPGGTLEILVQRGEQELSLSAELEPLVDRADWEASPIADPVERYLDLMTSGGRERSPRVRIGRR